MDTIPHPDDSDLRRRDFLRALDAAPFDVTEWEAEFLGSNLDRTTFTPAQRIKIDQMRRRYRDQLS